MILSRKSVLIYISVLVATIVSFTNTPLFAQTGSSNRTAAVGEVAKLGGGTITLSTEDATLEYATNGSTEVIGPKGKLTLAQIKVGNIAAVLASASGQTSSATQSGRPVAQKVFVRDASPSATASKVIVGTVTGVNNSEITLLDKNIEETYYTIVASSSGVIKGRGNQIVNLASITLGSQVVVVGSVVASDNTITPKLLHIISSN